jgi:hypothetical protein
MMVSEDAGEGLIWIYLKVARIGLIWFARFEAWKLMQYPRSQLVVFKSERARANCRLESSPTLAQAIMISSPAIMGTCFVLVMSRSR